MNHTTFFYASLVNLSCLSYLRELNTKERRQLDADRNSLTKHFIAELPELLSKFCTDDVKVVSLVEIPQYFQVRPVGGFGNFFLGLGNLNFTLVS